MDNSDAKSRMQGDSRLWVVHLRRPPASARELDPTRATASELMFFTNAPLAHVVAYEDWHRARQREHALQAGRRRNVSMLRHRGQSLEDDRLDPHASQVDA